MDLARALRREGVSSAAVCHSAGSDDERRALRDAFEGRVEFRTLEWWNRKIRAKVWKRPPLALLQIIRTGWGVVSTREVASAAGAHRAELIHTNTILTPEGARAAYRLGLPHVWHVRELTGEGRAFPIRGMRGRVHRLLEGSAVVIANSRATALALEEASGFSRITVVANGIDLAPLLKIAPRQSGRPVVVAMVGSLASHLKRHSDFLAAAGGLGERSGVEFRIYGGGVVDGDPYVEALRREAENLGLVRCLSWMGHVEPASAVMSEVDILVHPADQESFGRVLVEAMAAGRPVVAPRGGGAMEIVEHEKTGLLFTPGRPTELALAIRRLLDDSDLRLHLGAAGRAEAVARFSLERTAARVLDCYREALGRGSRRERAADT